MRQFFLFIIILLITSLNASVFSKLKIFEVLPNLLLVWSMLFIVDQDAKGKALNLLFAGLYSDLIFGLRFGYYLSAYFALWFLLPQVFQIFSISPKSKKTLPILILMVSVFTIVWVKFLNTGLLYLRVEE
jgi:cell shape-determining protein MreD